ncbi:HAD family hydrolase [Nocardioides guangzhouensis]|nr:HAD family hydrolase [Nocardioides guangzhouensis]
MAVTDTARPDTVVLDLDGTLVDSSYAHVVAWRAAFLDVGVDIPAERLHRAIGMGGDRLVAHVAGDTVEDRVGDHVRGRHAEQLDHVFATITATSGASTLLEVLRKHGFHVVLASSSDNELSERLLERVPGSGRLLQELVTGSEAEQTKPSGELVEKALARVEADRAVLVGDTVWDVASAQDAGVPCVGVLTGGIPEADLRDAGAVAVFRDAGALAEHVDKQGSLRL